MFSLRHPPASPTYLNSVASQRTGCDRGTGDQHLTCTYSDSARQANDVASNVAQVGHSDIAPPDFTIEGVDIQSWNSAHDTASCTEQGLAERRGAGRFYCFAID